MSSAKQQALDIKYKKEKPKTEVILSDLQKTYLEAKKTKGFSDQKQSKEWQSMFAIITKYAESLIKKKLKNSMYFPPDKIHDFAVDVAILIMRRYEEDDFKINKSFGGLLNWKIIEVMYNTKQKNEDLEYSLNFNDRSRGGVNKTEIIDLIVDNDDNLGTNRYHTKDRNTNNYSMQEYRVADFYEVVFQLLREHIESQCSTKLKILGHLLILLQLRKSHLKLNITNFIEKQDITPQEKGVLELLLLELKDRIRAFFNN